MKLLAVDRKVFNFIDGYLARNGGVCPSYREIMAGVGSKSLGHIAQTVTKLERSGLIRKIPNRRRALEIIRHKSIPIYDADTLQIRGFIS